MSNSVVPLLTRKAVSELTCLCRTSLYRAVRDGAFPAPIQVGKRRIAFRSDEVQAWIDSRAVGTRPTGSHPAPSAGA